MFERRIFMKKHLSFLLIFTIIFGMIFCVNVSAVNDDVNVNMGDFFGNDDPFAPKFTVSVEQGKDAGYITESKKVITFCLQPLLIMATNF